MLKKIDFKRELKSFLLMLFGAFLGGIAVNLFYIPTMLTMGGVSGIASVFYHLLDSGLSLGLITLILNLPVFALGLFFVNRAFILRSLIGTFAYSLVLDLTHLLVSDLYVPLILSGDPNGSPDLFLCAVVGGSLFGVGLGLVMLAKYTTGGTDILAVIIHKKLHHFSLGMALWLIDGVVIIFSAIAYFNNTPNSLNMALYSTISLYICAKAIDLVAEGFNFKRTAIIISEHSELIAERIMQDLGRGITGLHGTGMYTKDNKTVLLSVLAKSQIREARNIVAEVDENAFFFVMDTREVLGEGFEETSTF